MPPTLSVVTGEYEKLVEHLRLDPLPLDIYVTSEGSQSPSPGGLTVLGNATPGYSPRGIILPQDGPELDDVPFPPDNVEKMGPHWPVWRIELWHEVCHQVQHQRYGVFSPADEYEGHGDGWLEALDVVASSFGWSRDGLRAVIQF